MEKDYTIWVTYHRDEFVTQYGLKEDEHHRLFASHKPVEGKNINIMNPVLSEMVTMWYVWKNNIKSDYVGFEHYRRHLHITRMPQKGACQIYKTINFGSMTIYEQYSRCHNIKDMDVILSILNETYGNGNEYVKHITNSNCFVANCTFLMKWSDFVRLCKFLFPVLEEFSRRIGIVGYDEEALDKWREKSVREFQKSKTVYQMRVLSFLAERLISAWIVSNMKIYNGIDVAIVHYNTPELTSAAIRSLNKHMPGSQIFLFDNSDKKPFKENFANVKLIDNTKGKIIDFESILSKYPDKDESDVSKSNYGSAKHCLSVDKLMDIVPDGFLLMDSDILLTKSACALVDRSQAAVGDVISKHGVPLLQPFLCWINTPLLKKNNVRYFNGSKMWALTKKEPHRWYDTGAWLLEDLMVKMLPWRYANIMDYMVHFGHGSWRDNEVRRQTWLEENKRLWE